MERTEAQLRHHFEVEKELGDRLRHSTREERKALFLTLYDELFRRVPDHPRLTRRQTEADSRKAVEARLQLVQPYLAPGQTFLEFAPGDCRLAFAVSEGVDRVIGVDISDQAGDEAARPANFELIVYDGYDLDLDSGVADLAFSYMFLEHLHPEDIEEHLRLVHRLLKPGGAYVLSTPHRFSGPHDISVYFGDTPQGFHMKEWTHREMAATLRNCGFHRTFCYRLGRPWHSRIVSGFTAALEMVLAWVPARPRRRICRRLFPSVTMVAFK